MAQTGSAPASTAALSPAVAPPPGQPRFALFDALRGIAVLCIITYHVTSITGAMNAATIGDLYSVLGNQALIFFFVISGFLLYRPYAAAHAAGRRGPSTRRYARRRLLRIVPAYWTALTLLAIWPGITGVFTHDWWRYYFCLQAYSNQTLSFGIPPAWSLTVEVSFYILLPIWAWAIRSLGRRLGASRWMRVELTGLALVAALGVGIQVAASRLLVSSLLATTLLGECVWLALGMALAVVSVEDQHRATPRRVVAAVVRFPGLCWLGALACLLGATAVLHPGGLFNIILSLHERQPYSRTLAGIVLTAGLSAFLIAPAAFGEGAGGVPRRILAWRPLAGLGVVSYGVYLYHLTAGELLGEKADPLHFSASGLGLTSNTVLLFVLTVGVTAAVATVSYRVIELPFLRLKEGPARDGGAQ
ncbi:MAG TPA: acyltransferase [Solirubrobacteraceae bacterium]|jgi:peptidoglycan/LPS O-acetylase OafA/YrhL